MPRFGTLPFCLMVLAGVLSRNHIYVAARPVDSQEGKLATKLVKLGSGMSMTKDIVKSLLNLVPQPTPYPTTLQVQFVGLGRTGTTSLASAMTKLGYKVLHDDEATAVMDLYKALYDKTIGEDQLHDELGNRGYNCSFLYHDYAWAAKQPNVKVVLNRYPNSDSDHNAIDRWVDSWLTVARIYEFWERPPFQWIPTIQDSLPFLYQSLKVIPTGGYPDSYLNRDVLKQGYQSHYESVRQMMNPSPERFLEYSVTEGWSPLCEFLEIPAGDCPLDEPFPHLNDRFKVRVVMICLGLITWIVWPTLVGILLWFLGMVIKKGRSVAYSSGK